MVICSKITRLTSLSWVVETAVLQMFVSRLEVIPVSEVQRKPTVKTYFLLKMSTTIVGDWGREGERIAG